MEKGYFESHLTFKKYLRVFFQFISVDKNFLDIESSTVGQLNFVLYFLN